jgi:hypothetical protein
MKKQIVKITACALFVIGLVTAVVYAAKHVAVCVPAKIGNFTVTGGGCTQNNEGVCVGDEIYTQNAVHGYCDTTETGTCEDASTVLQILTVIKPCKKRKVTIHDPNVNNCVADSVTTDDTGNENNVTVPTCN